MKFSPKTILILIILIFLFGANSYALDKSSADKIEVSGDISELGKPRLTLISADTCSARLDEGFAWQIDGWVLGAELYKNYIDPEVSCINPYPYIINEVNMPLAFSAPTPISISVDIEQVIEAGSGCPKPGEPLTISEVYDFEITEAGTYNVWIPLDSPLVVNGPFFAGFFIHNEFDANIVVSAITDNDSTVMCASYNIWDQGIGFVDLNNNGYYNFPGRLVLYTAGISGGNSSENYVHGDYNNDSMANLADLDYFINYFLYNGPDIFGGNQRADANCDNHINMTDLIYYLNFLFITLNPPCQ